MRFPKNENVKAILSMYFVMKSQCTKKNNIAK